jgi:hypothetical protein
MSPIHRRGRRRRAPPPWAENQPLTNARGVDYTPRPGSRVPDVYRSIDRPRTTEPPWTGGIRTRLFFCLMRGIVPALRTRPNDGTHHDAARHPHRPTRPTGGHCGLCRPGIVVRRGASGTTWRLCARGYGHGFGMDEARARHARKNRRARQSSNRAGPAVQRAREDRSASLRGVVSTSHWERSSLSPRPRTDAGGAIFVLRHTREGDGMIHGAGWR